MSKKEWLQVGAMAHFPRTARRADAVTGRVVKVGRVNVDVQLRFRASPTGPWFEPIIKLPISEAVPPPNE